MSKTKQYRLDRKSRRKLAAIWKPEYDQLAHYNRHKRLGISTTPEMTERMEAVQKDYDENYRPASEAIRAAGKLHRVWW
jgi:hypothetical protein